MKPGNIGVVRKFYAGCSSQAELFINQINLELIAFYDENLLKDDSAAGRGQNSLSAENISIDISPMLKIDVKPHLQTMILCIWSFVFLLKNPTITLLHQFKRQKIIENITKIERKIVNTASSPNLRPILKKILQKNSFLLWKNIASEGSMDRNEDTTNKWLSDMLREKLKQLASSISSAEEQQIEQTKLAKKDINFVVKTVKKEARKAFNSAEPNNMKKLQLLGNKISKKLLGNSSNSNEMVIEKEGNTIKIITNSESWKDDQQQQRSENSANKTTYPPYTLDTVNDCILALSGIISPNDDVAERDYFLRHPSPQIEVRDLGLVFVEKVSTEDEKAEGDEQKRLEAVKENFLFIAYRQIVCALKQSEKSVEKSHLNGLIERNKRIFVGIILRSKRFEHKLRERNIQEENVSNVFFSD